MAFERISLLLVAGVGGALLVVVAGRAAPGVRLFLRCLRWGFATGAVTGAVTGALSTAIGWQRGDPWSPADLLVLGGSGGAFVGVIVAVIPTLLGAVLVTDLLRQRHPLPTSEEDVRQDLTPALTGVVLVLDVIVLVALVTGAVSAGLSSAAVAVPFIAAGNACVILMLWRARNSIARLWSGLAAHAALSPAQPAS